MKDKNIPAFPGRPQQDPNDVNKVIHNNGMMLRDYFAARAMPVLLCELYSVSKAAGKQYDNIYKIASEAAYEQADAMLAARDK